MLGKSQAKYIQSLGQKKVRDAEGVYIAEGPKIVSELLDEARPVIMKLFAVKDWIATNNEKIEKLDVVEVMEHELAKISQLSTPNSVLALVRKPDTSRAVNLHGVISLALDMIQDPGNLGTIIRIADWFGISQVICSHDCADAFNPKVVQASMGSILRVQVHYTDLAALIRQQPGIPVLAASLDGASVKTRGPLDEGLIVIGNESRGIGPEVMAMVNEKITIPRIGKAESLNAAVATGIILSHLSK